jgi:hypothetical protein
MQPFQKERLDNIICFFATEFKKKARRYPSQTQLYKFLAYFDFRGQEEFGIPPLGLTYRAMKNGPVPIELYSERNDLATDLYAFEVKTDKSKIEVIAKTKPNLEYFSKNELNLINDLAFMFCDSSVDSKKMSDASHESIKAWRKTWAKNQNAIIDYDLTFNDNIVDKPIEKLSAQEETYLVYKALK